MLYIFDDLYVRLYVSVSILNALLNHATQQNHTLYEGINKSREDPCQQWKFFERDLQSNSKKILQ